MWTFNIQPEKMKDTSGNAVRRIDYLKDGVIVLTRDHTIGSLDLLKLQIKTIQNQYDAAEALESELDNVDVATMQSEVNTLDTSPTAIQEINQNLNQLSVLKAQLELLGKDPEQDATFVKLRTDITSVVEDGSALVPASDVIVKG